MLMRATCPVERCISAGHSARIFFSLMEFSLNNRGKNFVFTQAILAPDMALTSVFPGATRTADYSCCGNFNAPQSPQCTRDHCRTLKLCFLSPRQDLSAAIPAPQRSCLRNLEEFLSLWTFCPFVWHQGDKRAACVASFTSWSL